MFPAPPVQELQLLILKRLGQRQQDAGGPCEGHHSRDGDHAFKQPPSQRQVVVATQGGVIHQREIEGEAEVRHRALP
jgi:hypothetical protein